ncbi:hypothetical protein QQ045_019774 [Rhodiola kirilowii]
MYGTTVTDKTLDTLSSNCPKLESVNFQGSSWFTPEALYTFFFNNPQLSSVDMPHLCSPSISKVVECMKVLQNLNHLSLVSDIVQDAVLIALAKLRPPLKSLRLRGSDNNNNKYTMSGLILLLSACPGLEKLKVHLPVPHFENSNIHDAEMSKVVKRLPKLKHIEEYSGVYKEPSHWHMLIPWFKTTRQDTLQTLFKTTRQGQQVPCMKFGGCGGRKYLLEQR